MQSEIDPKTQAKLNKPLKKKDGFSTEDSDFLDMLLDLVDSKKIDLYSASTLINSDVYDELSEFDQGKVDMEAMNLLAKIREIKDLCDIDYRETFQVENLVHSLRLAKERLEDISGDVFII